MDGCKGWMLFWRKVPQESFDYLVNKSVNQRCQV